jgi:hypothetical protein
MYLGVCHEEILLFYAEDDRFSAACVPRDIARVNANEEGSLVPRLHLTMNACCVMCNVG